MKYNCDLCNYSTDRLLNYERHNLSTRHRQKCVNSKRIKTIIKNTSPVGIIIENNTNDKSEHICESCGNSYKHKNNYYRHKKECKKSTENIELLREQMENKLLRQQMTKEREDKEYFKHMYEKQCEITNQKDMTISKSVSAISKSVSVIAQLAEKYPNAPMLEYLDPDHIPHLFIEDKKDNKKENKKEKKKENEWYFAEHIIRKYMDDDFPKYLADIIAKEYKKDDPEKQTMWVSDTQRIVFIVKELIEGTDENEWTYDKSGVKVRSMIVNPLLSKILDDIEAYNKMMHDKMVRYWEKNNMGDDGMELLRNGLEVARKIGNKSIHRTLMRLLAPIFAFNKDSGKDNEKDDTKK